MKKYIFIFCFIFVSVVSFAITNDKPSKNEDAVIDEQDSTTDKPWLNYLKKDETKTESDREQCEKKNGTWINGECCFGDKCTYPKIR